MSLPSFPSIDPPLELKDSLNMILASIAMEEAGLSHIINAEGEKLQYVLGTLDRRPDKKASAEEVLAVNNSVKRVLDSVMQNQIVLKEKMECAVGALELDRPPIGPPGPAGPPGPPGPPGPSKRRHSISFVCRPPQCWNACEPLKWLRSDCSEDIPFYLAPDCRKIIIRRRGCYAVNFSLDICGAKKEDKCVAVALRTTDCVETLDRFVCHAPALCEDVPVTASASGIFIPARDGLTELTFMLLSPRLAKVNQASVWLAEI